MDCKALLALIPDECKRRPRKRKRSSSRQGSSTLRAEGSHALRAGDGAVLDSAVDILALIPGQRDRMQLDPLKGWKRDNPRLKTTTKGYVTRQSMQQVVNARRFNGSGRAIRRDSMIPTEKVGKVKGSGNWKK